MIFRAASPERLLDKRLSVPPRRCARAVIPVSETVVPEDGRELRISATLQSIDQPQRQQSAESSDASGSSVALLRANAKHPRTDARGNSAKNHKNVFTFVFAGLGSANAA
jgi:hypothetical protein